MSIFFFFETIEHYNVLFLQLAQACVQILRLFMAEMILRLSNDVAHALVGVAIQLSLPLALLIVVGFVPIDKTSIYIYVNVLCDNLINNIYRQITGQKLIFHTPECIRILIGLDDDAHRTLVDEMLEIGHRLMELGIKFLVVVGKESAFEIQVFFRESTLLISSAQINPFEEAADRTLVDET